MRLVRFRHKALKRLYEDGSPRGVPPAVAEKLRKLLLAIETADALDQLVRFPDGDCTRSKAT